MRRSLALFLLMLLVGCSQTSTVAPPIAATAPPLPQQAVTGSGRLIMVFGAQDPANLDPALISDVGSAFVVRQLFSGLVRLDAQMQPQPDLAAGWEISADGREYRFTLREGIRFADGTPISANDVRYSLERATDPNLTAFPPAATYLNDIVGVREKLAGQAETISGLQIPDARTVVLTVDAPKSYFLAKLAYPVASVVDQRGIMERPEDWMQQPNSSGSFLIAEWQPGRSLVLAANPNALRLPKLSSVELLIGAEASNPLVLYEEGQVDITAVPPYALARAQDPQSGLADQLRSVPELSLYYIGLNPNIPPFDDPLIRQAFVLLVDRERLATLSLAGGAVPARGILPPGMPGYQEAGLPAAADNLAEARRLIAASRYGSVENLPPIVIHGDWAGVLRDILAEALGLKAEIRAYEDFGAYLEALNRQEFAAFGTGWIADYPDPENFLDLLFRSDGPENGSGYANPAVDALLDRAAVEPDPAQRAALYQQAERQILADAPLIPLYHDVQHLLVKPYVQGLAVTPLGILDLSTVELLR